MGKKDQPEPRQAVFDELGVARRLTKDGELDTGLYTSLSHIDVVDLLCEGGIQGIVSGEYTFQGNLGQLGYESYNFTPYKAVGAGGNCTEELGFLRSVYWNETPVVDKQGFYNFQEVNLEWTDGKPQGQVPALNSNLAFDKNLKGGTSLELSVFRSIGERLFGPSLHLESKKTGSKIESTEPGYYLGKQSPQPPILSGNIDRNAKTYIINNKECVGVRINIKVPRLMEQIQDDWNDEVGGTGDSWKGNEDKRGFFAQPEGTAKKGKQDPFGAGDMRARKIHYQIYSRPVYDTKHIRVTSEGVLSKAKKDLLKRLSPDWKHQPDIDDEIFGRMEQPYVRSVDIDFLDNENNPHKSGVSPRESERYKYFNGWEIRIIRLTPDSVHTHLQNESYVDSIVEMYDSKIRYPYCAMAYSKFSAEFFSRIPSRAYDTELLKVKIPNNYDPIKRTYLKEEDGTLKIWDGCFKAHKEWSNNPAWCFYDLITNNRYGLGEYIDKQFVDKWTLYEIAQYCDVLVSDGKGGVEPRFTLNHIITSREEAYKIINDMASAFRAIVYYAFGNIYVSQDRPRDPIYHFNTSNVTEGMFNYSSSAKKARHTVAIVRYADKNNMYKPAISYSEDQVGIQRYGIREIETTSIGCTSEAQAKRFGDWILRSEILETESVAFTAGQEGMYMRPGDVISIYDEFRNDRNLAGRTLKVEEGASGIIHSGVHCHKFFPRADESGDYRVTGNSIIIDKPLHFTTDKLYKLSLLTPTSYFEPTQITPPDCVESGTTTTIPAGIEVKYPIEGGNQDIAGAGMTFNSTYLDFSAGALLTSNPDHIPQVTRNIIVPSEKAEFSFFYILGQRRPVRFRLLQDDGKVLFDSKYVQNDPLPGENRHTDPNHTNRNVAHTPSKSHILHGNPMKLAEGGLAENGDLKACMAYYEGGTDLQKDFAREQNKVLCWEADGARPCAGKRITVTALPLTLGQTAPIAVTEIIKDAGITALQLEVSAPLNPVTTTPQGFASKVLTDLKRTAYYTLSVDEQITESITVTASNTDKALTSADIPEIRRNQIQTIYFSGFQAVPYTGNYSSEYSISGSGIVTQIWFDAAITTPLLDFDNYVITGYTTSDKIKSEWNSPVDFSTGYENPDGANLIWAIEPADSDITFSQNYTMDEEFSSGHSELYRVINIQENEKKYDISALEYTPIKYEPVYDNGLPPPPPPGDCLPPINPRITGNGDPPKVTFCCDGSEKDPNKPCSETADLTHADCIGKPPEPVDPVGACCVVCPEDPVSYECFGDNYTEEECMEQAVLKNSYGLRTFTPFIP